MKRFLIFVTICIVALGIGFTVFRFMSYDEIISVSQTVYEVNTGDTIKLDVETEHLKSDTRIETEIVGSGSVISKGSDDFTFLAGIGGTALININSNASGFQTITIQVTVGSGTSATPYFISSYDELQGIGSDKPLNAYYKLTADIDMAGKAWTPINDQANGSDAGFTGYFDFNGYTIRNMHINTESTTYAGLFEKIGSTATIKGANFDKCTIEGNYEYAGVLAGINAGSITNAVISDASIIATHANAMVGGLVGVNNGTIYKAQITSSTVKANGTNSIAGGLVGSLTTNSSVRASVTLSSSVATVSASYAVGGLVGEIVGSTVENCFAGAINSGAKLQSSTVNSYVGGIAGIMKASTVNSAKYLGALKDTYSVMTFDSTSNNKGAILGSNENLGSNSDASDRNKIYGNYYSSDVSGFTGAIAGQDDPEDATTSEFGVYNKTKSELTTDKETYYSYSNNGTSYSWDFDNIWIFSTGSMPTLNFDAVYVSSSLDMAQVAGSINSVSDLKKIANTSDKYQLSSSFTITSASNYTPIDFNGTLVGELNADGTPKYTITIEGLTLDDGCAALFATLGQNAVIKDICVNVAMTNVNATSIASIAVVNNGKILNCTATGSLSSNIAGETVFMGGIAAENYGIVQSCKSEVALTLVNEQIMYYVGGIVGYNHSSGTVEGLSGSATQNSGTITIDKETSMGYVGGIVGQTDGKVSYTTNKGSLTIAGTSKSSAYLGGVAGNVNGALVTTSSNFGNLTAVNVGGVAGYVTGFVTECMSQAEIRGKYVGGIICTITKNYVSDCVSMNNLSGFGTGSILNGLGYYFNIKKKASYAINTFIACTYTSGTASKYYYETISDVRGGSGIKNYWLCIEGSIYVKDIVTVKAKQSVMPFEWCGWMFGYYYDCGIKEAEAKGTTNKGFQVFYKNGYSTSIWLFSTDSYPSLINVAK